MIRAPFILSAMAVAVLAGCASTTESGITSAPAPAPAAAAAAPAAPTYSVGAAGTTVVVPDAGAAPTAVVTTPAAPLRVGFGRIDSILVVPNSAAGGTAPNTSSKRIAMRMDDGTLQYFDTNADNLKVGDRIEITTNGTMRHPA